MAARSSSCFFCAIACRNLEMSAVTFWKYFVNSAKSMMASASSSARVIILVESAFSSSSLSALPSGWNDPHTHDAIFSSSSPSNWPSPVVSNWLNFFCARTKNLSALVTMSSSLALASFLPCIPLNPAWIFNVASWTSWSSMSISISSSIDAMPSASVRRGARVARISFSAARVVL